MLIPSFFIGQFLIEIPFWLLIERSLHFESFFCCCSGLTVFLSIQFPQLSLNELSAGMILAQLFFEYLQSPLEVCRCIRTFALRLCRLAQIAQNHRSVEVAWPMQRFDNMKRSVIVASRIPQAPQIMQHVAQDAGSKGDLCMTGAVDSLIDFQGSLKMQLRPFCISLSLQHSPQIIQRNGNMRVVQTVIGFFRLQVFLIVAAGDGQIIANLIERPQAYGIPSGLGIDTIRIFAWAEFYVFGMVQSIGNSAPEHLLLPTSFDLNSRLDVFHLDKVDPSFIRSPTHNTISISLNISIQTKSIWLFVCLLAIFQ
jgi:hypothetical protein